MHVYKFEISLASDTGGGFHASQFVDSKNDSFDFELKPTRYMGLRLAIDYSNVNILLSQFASPGC